MDYDYIFRKKKKKIGGRKRAEERSKKPGLSRAGDPWRETTSSEKNGWAANRATHGALSGYFAFYLTVPWQRALIECVLNYVFTCVSSINERNEARVF